MADEKIEAELDKAHDVLMYAAEEIAKPVRAGGLPDLRELADAAATLAGALDKLATTRANLAYRRQR